MRIVQFQIENFKGISKTKIIMAGDTPGNVGTLIGLNESGKTTILEALSHFVTQDKDINTLVGTVQQGSSLQDLIPKDKKAAFTGSISIGATVELDEGDVTILAQMFESDHKLDLDRGSFDKTIEVESSYSFQDSTFKEQSIFWTVAFSLKPRRGKKYKKFDGDKKSSEEDLKIWKAGLACIQKRIPKIVYFPTFLFDFPDRIYLENEDGEVNSYYKQVVQDVLDSQGDKLDVQKHIIERINASKRKSEDNVTFMARFFGRDEKKQIDAVLQTASNEMSRVIFGAWNQVLGRNVTGKRVQVDWFLDVERENAPYLEISIVDGASRYSLSERSLGFRWFFSFLLFTQFRRNRKSDGGTIFLFDEPAANLHSKAQMKLLESFSRIAHGATYIIYSTHSHYMINPLWLEKAYIVENRALNYDNEDDVDSFAIRKSDIRAIKYKTFVGSYPTKTTYFQPVLDALEAQVSPMIKSSRAIIIEGKNDYHPFVYLTRCIKGEAEFEVYPVNGAGDAGCLICLFRGWGVKFRLLLDDDRAGRQAKKKFIEEYFLSQKEVATIGDIVEELKGKEFESIYAVDIREAVMNQFNTGSPDKSQFSIFFQELLSTNGSKRFVDTEAAFKPILDWVDGQLN